MTRRDELFAAILASPDDDNVRLVYADWLEDQGVDLARAMLIHRQVQCARLPRWDRRHAIADRECASLLARHGDRWRAALPALDGIAWTGFDRGFCNTVRADAVASLYRHAAAIAAAAPVTRVELHAIEEVEHAFSKATVPWLRTLRFSPSRTVMLRQRDSIISAAAELELELQEGDLAEWLDARDPAVMLDRLTLSGGHTVGVQFAVRLAAAPWAKRLSTLELATGFVDHDTGYFNDPTMRRAGSTALAEARLSRVQVLDVTNQRLDGDGLAAIVGTMPILRELRARRCEVTELGRLVSHETGTPIVALDLSENAFGCVGLEALAAAPRFAALESLAVNLCEIRAHGLAALTRGACWSTLHVLDLGNNSFGVDGMVALVDAAPPAHLHALSLANDDFTAELVEKLVALPWVGALEALDLSRNELGDNPAVLAGIAATSVRALRLDKIGLSTPAALAPAWSRLVTLSLAENPLGERIAGLISDEESALLELDLSYCELTPAAIAVLLRARCPELRRLKLTGNLMGVAMFAELLRAPMCANLEELDVSHCGLSEGVIAALAGAPALDSLRVLNLRGHHFKDQTLKAIAQLPTLRRVTTWKLDASPWSMPEADRAMLTARFGPLWWYEEEPYEAY